jgi:hypothetical protein
MARELQTAGSDSDPGLVIVKDEKHHTVLSIPFLTGFALRNHKPHPISLRVCPNRNGLA